MHQLYATLLLRKESHTLYPPADHPKDHLEVDEIEARHLAQEYSDLEETYGDEFHFAVREARGVHLAHKTTRLVDILGKIAMVRLSSTDYRVWVKTGFRRPYHTDAAAAFKLACHLWAAEHE